MIRTFLAGAIAAAALAGTAAPAGAQTVRQADPSEPGLRPSEDIRAVRYTNDRRGFAARVTMHELSERNSIVVLFLQAPGDWQFSASVIRLRDGTVRKHVSALHGEDADEQDCEEMTARWRFSKDRIDLFVPWSCLAERRDAVRATTSFAFGKRTDMGEPSDLTDQKPVRYR